MQIFYLYFLNMELKIVPLIPPIPPTLHLNPPPSLVTGEVAFSLAKMTEGADVSDTANLSVTVVGADPCVRPGNVNRVNRTIRFNRDKRTCNSAHKNTSKIK